MAVSVDVNVDIETTRLVDTELYLPLDSDANDDSSNALTPSTETGGIIYPSHIAPKLGAGAVQLAEATTNLITNSGFEENTTGWIAGGTNTIAQSTEQAKVGSNSLKCTYQDNNNLVRTVSITATAVPHSYGIWLYVPADYDGTAIKIVTVGFAGVTGNAAVSANMSLRDQWQYVGPCLFTPDAGDLAGEFYAFCSGGQEPSPGKYFYIDAAQVEAKAYPTPYCDGSLGTGHTWSGTAHASTSSRTATDLRHTLAQTAIPYTVACWMQIPYLLTEQTNYSRFWEWYYDANDRAILYVHAGNDAVTFTHYTSAGDDPSLSLATGISRMTWYHAVVTYDGTNIRGYWNGSLVAGPTAATAQANFMATMHVGNYGGSLQANGWLDDFVVLDYALTADQVALLYSQNMRGNAVGIWDKLYDDAMSAAPI